MKRYPAVPGVDEAPDGFFDGGHLWLRELVAGEAFRFQVRESGRLRVGTRRRVLDPDEMPLRYRHAVRYVRDSLDVPALREAVEDVESVTFLGVATHEAGVTYDWRRLPSVLCVDVWDGARGEFLAVDAVERALDAFGLDAVDALRKEVHVRDFDPSAPEMPASAWYDGPVAGVVLRKKTGERVAVPNPDVDVPGATATRAPPGDLDPAALDAESVAAATATRERFERVARTVEDRGLPASFDTVYDRLLDAIYREEGRWLLDDDDGRGFDLGAFRDAVAARTSEFLESR